ncbi:MAG: aminotransferase class I/II-fold pyridoxal phosphate-dependent enzyme, partial [Leptolinea sp.]
VDCILHYGLSTASSRGGYGEHPVYSLLEKEICKTFDSEKALLLPSGFMGMAVLLQVDGTSKDHLFIDSDAHFSVWDAATAANKPITPFRHLNSGNLLEKIQLELLPSEIPVVVSDGVFPISGEIAPLPEYLEILKTYNGRIYLDDAHGMGALGIHGRGILDYFNIQSDICQVSGTLSKAFGGYGGIITGSSKRIDHMEKNSSICAGASPPAIVTAAASAKALSIARENPQLRENLWANVKQARTGLNSLGWDLPNTPVPILCLPQHKKHNPERLREQLFERGIAVPHVRGYTSTPPGGALRIAIFATHTADQIDRLVVTLGALL